MVKLQYNKFVVRSGGRGLGNLFTAVVNRVATRFTTAKVATRFTTAVNKFPSPLPPDRTTNTVKPIDSTKQGRKSNPGKMNFNPLPNRPLFLRVAVQVF